MEYNQVTPEVVAALQQIAGEKYVWTERDKRIPYGQDEGTGQPCLPDVVVLPATTEELAAVVRLANDVVIPLIPRGTGTGLEGGAVADSRGGIMVSTERMDRILEINEDAMYMTVEAGVITAVIQEEAASGDCSMPVTLAAATVAVSAATGRPMPPATGPSNTGRRGIKSMPSKSSRRQGKSPISASACTR